MFREGDPADKFYIILSGSCSVLSTSPLLPNHQRLLGILRQGDYFGELALLNNQPRMASILCREHCYFACLSRDDYLRILSKMQDRLISVKVELLLKQPVFRRMSKNALIKFTYYFKIKHYKRKQVVFESGTDANWLYLVKSGDFQLTKDVNLGQFRVQVDVTLLSTGEFLASEDILNRRNYTYSCVCHSTTGELMALGKKDFFSMMGSEENMHYFAELGKLKEEYRKERLKTAIKVETEKRVGGGKRISGHVRWNSCKEEDLMGGRKEELQNSAFLSRTYSSYLHSTLEHSGIKSKPSLPRSPHSVSRKPLSLTLHMHKLRRISTLYPSH